MKSFKYPICHISPDLSAVFCPTKCDESEDALYLIILNFSVFIALLIIFNGRLFQVLDFILVAFGYTPFFDAIESRLELKHFFRILLFELRP